MKKELAFQKLADCGVVAVMRAQSEAQLQDIAKALVELHGGRLEIRSVKGQGTEVLVILPSRHEVSVAEGRDLVMGSGSPI